VPVSRPDAVAENLEPRGGLARRKTLKPLARDALEAGPGADAIQEDIQVNGALVVERQADLLGVMAEDERKEPTERFIG
jgi:hypothetical protein